MVETGQGAAPGSSRACACRGSAARRGVSQAAPALAHPVMCLSTTPPVDHSCVAAGGPKLRRTTREPLRRCFTSPAAWPCLQLWSWVKARDIGGPLSCGIRRGAAGTGISRVQASWKGPCKSVRSAAAAAQPEMLTEVVRVQWQGADIGRRSAADCDLARAQARQRSAGRPCAQSTQHTGRGAGCGAGKGLGFAAPERALSGPQASWISPLVGAAAAWRMGWAVGCA